MKLLRLYIVTIIFSFIVPLFNQCFSQTLYWQKITDDYYVYDMLYDGEQYLYFSGSDFAINKYLLRSSDLGMTWEIVGGGLNGNGIYRLAVDSLGVLWGGVTYGSNGIYRSTNNGVSWSRSISTSGIFSITVSPNNWVWAGTEDGKVFYTSNSGNTWSSSNIDDDIFWSIASNSSNHIFAGNGNGKLYRSTNDGVTWELVYSASPPISIMGLVIDSVDNIYANNYTKRLISTDNGNTWTIISGIGLERLFLNKEHIFYSSSGADGYRSLDNCLSWNLIGPISPNSPNSFVFVDSLIFAGTRTGVFLHDPSYQQYIGQYYLPLMVGNKWQFNRRCNNHFAGNSSYSVINDTIILYNKYFLLNGFITDWVRYDENEHKLFLRWSDTDYLVMDFTLNEGSTFNHMLFNSHEIKTATILAPKYISIFDSSYHSKGNYWSEGDPTLWWGYATFYSESLGETIENYYYSGPGGTEADCTRKLIRAIINDSSGVKYYSDHVKPIITFDPIVATDHLDLNWDFSVDHYYSHFDNDWDVNFIDSVLMYSYYSNGDTTFLNNPVIAINTPHSTNYSVSFMLDSTLMTNDFTFFYKIYAVDKGIVSESATSPDSGYYNLIYDTTATSVLNENEQFKYELNQNYPNPFNPVTQIEYSIKEKGFVELTVFDILGRKITTLVNQRQSRGKFKVAFDAADLASGIYFYQLKVNDFTETKKMILLR